MRLVCCSALMSGMLLVAVNSHAFGVGDIVNSSDAYALASVLAGTGVSISNATLYGADIQQGFFASGGVIGLDQGVILSTGDAWNAIGPNQSSWVGESLSSLGDADLTTLLGVSTFDSNLLSFNFTTSTGSLFFSYVFASDEYNESIGTPYNDVFAAFVNGENVALLPNSVTPISINTIHCGNRGVAASNCTHFVDNTGAYYHTEYDGFTTVLTAAISGLDINQVHHLKLAIADATDGWGDSAVFLQANSFHAGASVQAVPEEEMYIMLLAGLVFLSFAAHRRSQGLIRYQ